MTRLRVNLGMYAIRSKGNNAKVGTGSYQTFGIFGNLKTRSWVEGSWLLSAAEHRVQWREIRGIVEWLIGGWVIKER